MTGNGFLKGERLLSVLALCTGVFSVIMYPYPNTFVRFYIKQAILLTALFLLMIIIQIVLVPIALLTWSWIVIIPAIIFVYTWARIVLSAVNGKMRRVTVPYADKLDVLDTLFPMP